MYQSGSSHPPRQYLAYGKRCAGCGKINHFREVCRHRSTAVHNIKQVPDQCNVEEDHIDMVNINSITFNSKWSAITANLKMTSNQVSVIISYNIDTGSDGNIMPLHLCKKLFPKATVEHLVATKNKNVQLKMYNTTTAYLDPMHLPAKACQVWKQGIATLK